MTDLAQLEKQKKDMLAAVTGWSAARLAYRPAEGEWSVAEMLDHIVKVETGIARTVRQNLDHPHEIGIRDQEGVLYLDQLFRSDRKVKVPGSASGVLPAASPDLKAVTEEWNESRKNFSVLLEQITPQQMTGGVFQHPAAGWMNVPQVINFLSSHLVHHNFQLNRLTEASAHLSEAR